MRAVLLLLLCVAGCAGKPPAVGRTAWLKGQTHVHSSGSGDSATPPAEVARWYAVHGYDFIVLTDHNVVTTVPAGVAGDLLVIPGVELTQNAGSCDPPPEQGYACLLHLNALFVRPGELAWPDLASERRIDIYRRALAMTAALGGLAQLNHPNFHWAADAQLVTELARAGALLLEIANESGDVQNAGDATHPDSEALWDAALTAGATVWGVASDDAHHYADAGAVRARGEPAYTGDRGWVMVRAARDPAAIRAALARGDFYSSTGVRLDRVDVSAGVLALALAHDTPDPGAHRIRFIGAGGRVLADVTGRAASYRLADAPGSYVRAVISDAAGRRAWTQPVRSQTSRGG